MPWVAAILLPQFPLQAALRLREEAWKEPVAITEGSSEKGRVLEMTEVAALSGVRRGMISTQALARCATLRLWSRSFVQERVVNALLLEMAGTLSPLIEDTRDGLCLVDLRKVKSCDWGAWAHDVVARFAARQLRVQVGVAANPDLATLAATHAAPVLVVQHPGAFLSGVAMAEVEAPLDLLAVLRDWGITHLGDLARLPRSDVVERLGPEAGELWERAAGRAQRELRYVRPPEIFFEAFDFEYPIETTEPLLFILRRQLEQLALRLREALRVATRMTLTLVRESGEPISERVFTIPSPTADLEVLFRVLHTHLETLRLEDQPTGVRLLIEPVVGESCQHQLFESALRDPNGFGETLARIHVVVGEGNVGVVQIEDTHRPDRFHLVAPQFEQLSDRQSLPLSRALGLPLRRFRPPLPAQVELQRHVPQRIRSEKAYDEIIDAAGPYRASGHWWDRDVWTTEEWDVELSDGGLYRISKHHDTWLLEGCYDAAVC